MAKQTETEKLINQIATRERSADDFGFYAYLPDPDPVLAKLGQSIKVYRNLMADAHVGSCVISRKSYTLASEWEIREPIGGLKRVSRQARELAEKALSKLNVNNIISDILQAPLYGMAPIEVVWQALDGLWLPAKVEGKPPEWFVFDEENRLKFLSKANYFSGEEIPPYRFLLPRHFPDYQNPYGDRLLARCFWPVAFKKGGFKFWAIFTEKYGMPWLVGKVPPGTNDTKRATLLEHLEDMVQDAVAVINNDENIDITEAAGKSASADIYERLIKVANREISKALLGQTLSTELDGGGSLAATESHMEIRGDLGEQDKRLSKNTLNELINWIIALNLGETPAPEFAFYQEEDIQTERATRDEILTRQGVKFRKPYYMRTYNLEEDDFDLVEPTPITDGAFPAFAEQKKNRAETIARNAQEALDALSAQSAERAQPVFDNYKRQLIEFIRGCRDLKDAAERLGEVYTRINAAPLGELLGESLSAAEDLGKISVNPVQFAAAERQETFPFRAAAAQLKARGLAIAGITKADLLSDLHNELITALTDGETLEDFSARAEEIFTRHGYDQLSPYRIKTIFQTNLQSAYQAARYQQLTDPDVLKMRPYWRYVAILDAATRPEHAAMHGKIFPADDPIWDTWYPPCGFNCRCTVIAVSEAELRDFGWRVETEDPTGKLFEPLDLDGNPLPARALMPDRGFGARGRSLEAMVREKEARGEPKTILWKTATEQKTFADFNRPLEMAIAPNNYLQAPQTLPSLKERIETQSLTKRQAFDAVENDFRKAMGISPKESIGAMLGPDGEAIKIDLNGLAHSMLNRTDARERYIPFFRKTIESPYEIWLTRYESEQGKSKFRKRIIGLFADADIKKNLLIVADITADGSTFWNVMPVKEGTLNRLRKGELLWNQ